MNTKTRNNKNIATKESLSIDSEKSREAKKNEKSQESRSLSTPAMGLNIAIYARVSSRKQDKNNDIESQLKELKNKADSLGFHYASTDIFTDDGYSGATLNRPGLENLRDRIYDGIYKKVLVYDPDRLARDYVYQTLLIDEIKKAGCKIEFVRAPIGETPEQKMLLQVQGMISEYERTKILERTKRGRLHRMQKGELVHGGDVYGYKYIRKKGDIPAHYKVINEEAKIIKTIFTWFVEEKMPIRKIARRLDDEGVSTIRGGRYWGPSVVHRLLKNSIYTGTGYANKGKAIIPKSRLIDSSKFKKYEKTGIEKRPKEEWYPFNSPRIVSDEIFELASQQLEINKQISDRRTIKEYLLKSYLKCGLCGFTMAGHKEHYQCQYSKPAYAKGRKIQVCENKQRIPMKELDDIIWKAIKKILKSPKRLRIIFKELGNDIVKKTTGNIDSLLRKQEKLNKEIKRINELYYLGNIEIEDYKKLYEAKKELLNKIKNNIKEANNNYQSEEELKEILNSFKEFSNSIKIGLDDADFEIKRRAVIDVIKSVEINLTEYIINFALPLRRKKGTLRSRSLI